MFNLDCVRSAVNWVLQDRSVTREIIYRSVRTVHNDETMKSSEYLDDYNGVRAYVTQYSPEPIVKPDSVGLGGGGEPIHLAVPFLQAGKNIVEVSEQVEVS